MNYILAITLGLLPSLIWLSYYLKKDIHPEPKKLILKVFILGAIASIPAIIIELGAHFLLDNINFVAQFKLITYCFIVVAVTEETVKYLVVKFSIIKNPAFDEPIDGMIYMISSALGFAAIENILSLSPLVQPFLVEKTIVTITTRFFGSTFLHTLTSGIVGYFLGTSFFRKKKTKYLVPLGFTIAIFLHGLYDYSIIVIPNRLKLISLITTLLGLFLIILIEFHKLRNTKINYALKKNKEKNIIGE